MTTGYSFTRPNDVLVAMRTFESVLRFIEEAVDLDHRTSSERIAVSTIRRELDAKAGERLAQLLSYSPHDPKRVKRLHDELLGWFLGVYENHAKRTGAPRWPRQCSCGGRVVSELLLKELPSEYWGPPEERVHDLDETCFTLNDLIEYQEGVRERLLQRTTLLAVLATCIASLGGAQSSSVFEEACHTLRMHLLQRIHDVQHRLLQLKVLAVENSGEGLERLKKQVRSELRAVNCMVLLDPTGSDYSHGYRTDTANELRRVLGLELED